MPICREKQKAFFAMSKCRGHALSSRTAVRAEFYSQRGFLALRGLVLVLLLCALVRVLPFSTTLVFALVRFLVCGMVFLHVKP